VAVEYPGVGAGTGVARDELVAGGEGGSRTAAAVAVEEGVLVQNRNIRFWFDVIW
jgi:hypothetical protein